MTLYDDYRNTDYLDDISFIAGTEITLDFPVYDTSGVPINVTTASMVWVLGLYGQPEAAPILQSGVGGVPAVTVTGTTTFTITLREEDTVSLGDDIYLQQIKVTDSTGKTLRPAQGIVVIRKAIPIA